MKNQTYAARRGTQRQRTTQFHYFHFIPSFLLTPFFSLTVHKLSSMMWEWNENEDALPDSDQPEPDSHLNFDFFSALSRPKDYYKILEVDYDATDDAIRSNYIRLALKWHPDKQKDQDSATSRFQDINEAYQVLSDPAKRREYDINGMRYVYDYNIIDYLNRYKGLILTCNGLGMKHSIW